MILVRAESNGNPFEERRIIELKDMAHNHIFVDDHENIAMYINIV